MLRYRIVVQARLSSSRLPGKAVLPIRGVPCAALAALRAGRNGADVVVATSIDPGDDILVDILQAYGLRVVRGPLDDVLGRVAKAIDDLSHDAVVIRLTADNMFPDADLVEELVGESARTGHAYLTTWSVEADAPYGLSAEAIRVGVLREAARKATSPYDREHVTPWIRRSYGAPVYRPTELPAGSGRLRCTIDTLEDYEQVARVFGQVKDDPVGVPWLRLCTTLAELPRTPKFTVPSRDWCGSSHSAIVLGTAQLGPAYGRINLIGTPSDVEASRIIHEAVRRGVTHLDTARAYGESERRIGMALRQGWGSRVHVVTKLMPMRGLEGASKRALINAVDASVFRSCRELGVDALDTLLVHHAADMTVGNGAVWQRLKELRTQGVIGQLGVSVQSVNEAKAAFADPDVAHIQLPFNILDWRWSEAHIEQYSQSRPDITIHARSVYLQGILVAHDATRWPRIPGIDAGGLLRAIDDLAMLLGRESRADLCLAFVRAHTWVTGAVVGVERLEQLMDNLRLSTRPPLAPDELRVVHERVGKVNHLLLDPARWPNG